MLQVFVAVVVVHAIAQQLLERVTTALSLIISQEFHSTN